MKLKTDFLNIKTKNELMNLFSEIRSILPKTNFNSEKNIDAYFKTSILLFNNLEKPYWNDSNHSRNYGDYFLGKMDFEFNGNTQDAVNSLLELWNNKTLNTIEYNLRGLEFLMREYRNELSEETIRNAVKYLKPIIEEAENEHL